MTVLLRITRTTGFAESYELDVDGSRVHVPLPLMTAADIVSLDVDVEEGEARDERCVAGGRAGGTGAGPRGI